MHSEGQSHKPEQPAGTGEPAKTAGAEASAEPPTAAHPPLEKPSAAAPPTTTGPTPGRPRWRRWLLASLFLLLAGAALYFWGLPWVFHYFTHESTDDAYVNSYVTYVSPRIPGNVLEVLVQDNDYVEPGTVLVRLDPEPYRLAVEQKRAALAQARLTVGQQIAAWRAAEVEVEQARHQVRAQVASLWGYWYLLQTIQNLVRYQEASLRSSLANLRLQEANLALAQSEHDRYAALAPRGAASKEMLEQKQAALRMAREQVALARQGVAQVQALLGLAPTTTTPPPELTDTYPAVRYALTSAQQTLEQLGLSVPLSQLKTSAIWEMLKGLDLDSLLDMAPAVRLALARREQARAALGGPAFDPAKPEEHPLIVQASKELEQAELNLRYTVLTAPIAGFVNRRNVNPGNQVQPGQALLALRPLHEVWVDANFKETQIQRLCIGQAVDLYVDAYPDRVFHGRISGFSPGTGAALSLLPPENATGNFVKVVQRLPVRIDLTEPVPAETPLFVGLSVVVDVDLRTPPSGPHAGQRLRFVGPLPATGR
jgi:membrane fusion protein (multidrug efflux system)